MLNSFLLVINDEQVISGSQRLQHWPSNNMKTRRKLVAEELSPHSPYVHSIRNLLFLHYYNNTEVNLSENLCTAESKKLLKSIFNPTNILRYTYVQNTYLCLRGLEYSNIRSINSTLTYSLPSYINLLENKLTYAHGFGDLLLAVPTYRDSLNYTVIILSGKVILTMEN